MKKLTLPVLLLSITLLTTQCSKEGPPGETGPQGPTGTPGSSSVRSKTVTYTDAQWGNGTVLHWFSTNPGSSIGYTARFLEITEPLITQSIIDNGVLLVYFTPDVSVNAFTNLPFSFVNIGVQHSFNIQYVHSINKIRLLFFFAKTTPASPNPPAVGTWVIPTYKFKYVIIPGTAITGRSASGAGNDKIVELKGNFYTMTELQNMPYSSISALLDI